MTVVKEVSWSFLPGHQEWANEPVEATGRVMVGQKETGEKEMEDTGSQEAFVSFPVRETEASPEQCLRCSLDVHEVVVCVYVVYGDHRAVQFSYYIGNIWSSVYKN